ncbi:hypothetical protein L6164_020097 [Bauhinia variegata]|uniref:Uncharacterized protein n=1 Tax=Bauhinia variegata TaxID=167791 RepID=A0ACB9MVK4_BAUVA|nr:hypothetical protein L6164_020097 [Bauhinia variegata]
MALLKSRGTRRSSSSSYSSTLTTLVFIAVCVLGVWMLTSNTVVPPQPEATTRTTIDTTNNDFSSSSEDSRETTTAAAAEGNGRKDAPVFGDNPGQLPEDAIKPDDKNPSVNTNNVAQKEAVSTSDAQISEESSLTQKQASETAVETSSEVNQQSDKKIFESQKVQPTVTNVRGGSEGSKKNEEEAAKSQKDENPDAKATDNRESQDVKVKETKDIEEVAKKVEDELNKQQLREGKGGEIAQESKKEGSQKHGEDQQQKQQETGKEGSLKKSQELLSGHEGEKPGDPQLSQQKTRDGNEDIQKPKTEKKQMDADKNDNAQAKARKSFTAEKKESKKAWSTQVDQSQNEKERQKNETNSKEIAKGITWLLCNVTADTDYIPCLDNQKAIKQLRTTRHFEHRERHCPPLEEAPTCLVPLPKGYKTPIEWPSSRDKIWYHNVPHTKLVEVKGHQNWVKVSGEFLTFPGGGTQFIHGALHYIDFIQQAEPNIAWGKRTRVILDVGCGVGSFGGYLFERDVITMSFAPKDEHEAQVQFALERGIPTISAVMGSQRLPFPSRVFDLIHCARCRVPWHVEGGKLLLELNRLLRPGGYFVWSATPVYQKLEEDVQIWQEMSSLTMAMCWELVTINRDTLNSVGAAIYQKPTTNECYEQREKDAPPMCKEDDDSNAAWYVPLQACMHRVPVNPNERGAKWPEAWPLRLQKTPYWLNNSQMGIYGKPASQDFEADNERWKNVIDEMSNIGITWSNVRNVMDMRAVYGGFAAVLRDLPVWVFNVVNVDAPDTLPIIYERGLFGMYHDWCESFSTYPRTYDLLHADQLFSKLKMRCKLAPVLAEVDRVVRPGGKLVVRDESNTIGEVEILLKSLHWEIPFSKKQEMQQGMLLAKKGTWRPSSYADSL